jgi:hypothetical protein
LRKTHEMRRLLIEVVAQIFLIAEFFLREPDMSADISESTGELIMTGIPVGEAIVIDENLQCNRG